MKAENIDINSKKMKRKKKKKKKKKLVKFFFTNLEKEYRDCIKRKWRQDWYMNETL